MDAQAQEDTQGCIGRDLTCPCIDGDPCHYKEAGATKAWPLRSEMDRHLLERASRMFNSVADLRTEEDQRINEWFKAQIAARATCQRCGAVADADIHYRGTVDSHEFVAKG